MNTHTYVIRRTVGLALMLSGMLLPQVVLSQETIKRGTIDPLYFQLYGGINKSANENLPLTEYSRYPYSGGMFIGVGKEWSPLWGWRVAVRYNRNKSRNVRKCEAADTWGWNSIGTFADATFDLTDALRPIDKEDKPRIFNLKLLAGVGISYAFDYDKVPLSYTADYSRKSRVVAAMRAGIDASFHLSQNWRLGAELSYTAFADRFNGVKTGCPVDGRSNIKVGVTYLLGKRKAKETNPQMPIALDSRLRNVPALPFILPQEEEVKKRKLTGRAFLDFPVNETIIYPNYRRNPQEIKRICATIDSALFDKTMQVTSISLHGYASPESPYSNNTRLAKGRTAALMEYLKRHYNLSVNLFHTTYTPEDWANLRGFLATNNRRRTKGDIWYENAAILETPETPAVVIQYRDELLRVIDLNIDPDEKEAKLKLIGNGEPYKWLLQHVYPGLRHTDYVIDYVVRSYPVKQGRRLIYTHPEALSIKEMYAVANSYEKGSDGWFDALTIAAKQYPESQTANLNAACACVQAHRLSDAKLFLKNAGATPQASYLSDVIKAMEGKAKWQMVDGKVILLSE